jgi:hypothetical protein
MRRWAPFLIGFSSLLGCRQILDLDDFTNQDVGPSSGTSVGGGSVGGGGVGGMSTASCGHFRALFDDFEDNTFARSEDRPGWSVAAEYGNAYEQLGEAQIQLTPIDGAAYARVSAEHAADLRGDSVIVRVVGIPSSGNSAARVRLVHDGNNYVGFEAHTGGPLVAMKFIDGNAAHEGEVAYNPAEHVHWQLEQSGDDLIWSTSPDRITWTPLATIGTDTLPFALERMWLQLDALSEMGSTTYADARFDDVNDPGNVEPWCPASSFSDDFADGALQGGWLPWNIPLQCTATPINGELELAWTGMIDVSCNYRTSTAFNLEGSSATLQVPFVAADPQATVFLRVNFDGDDWFELRHEMGASVEEIRAVKSVNATLSTEDSAAYEPTKHAWWRLREKSGSIYWETSPDGMRWTTLADTLLHVPLTAVDISFGVMSVAGAGGTARFRGYNLLP